MLLGPRDFPDFRAEIISDISKGAAGAMKNEFTILSPMKLTGDLFDLGILLVISWETLTKNLLKMFAITVGSDVILPFESLSLFIISTPVYSFTFSPIWTKFQSLFASLSFVLCQHERKKLFIRVFPSGISNENSSRMKNLLFFPHW